MLIRFHQAVSLAFFLSSLVIFSFTVSAQSTGLIRGVAVDSTGTRLSGVNVRLSSSDKGTVQESVTDETGSFRFFNIPFGSYLLSTDMQGFDVSVQNVTLNSIVPLVLEIQLNLTGFSLNVEVTSSSNEAIEPARSDYAVSSTAIENLTSGMPSRQIENLVLSTPGIIKDGKGVFHARGAHNQSSFVIDGIPVSDQLSAIYANSFDARNIEAMSVQTGNIAPEFGNKVSAVIQVSTRSGLGSGRRLFGGISLTGGTFNTGEAAFRLGGESVNKKSGWLISGANSFTDRFLDGPFQNATAIVDGLSITADGKGLNNYGNGQSFFARLDHLPNEKNIFKLNLVAARSRFNIANLPTQEIAGQRQVQENRNLAFYPSWQHIFNSKWSMIIAPYARFSTADSADSPADTPITFSFSRHLPTFGIVANAAFTNSRHQLKFGIDAFAFPASEAFNMQITDAGFNPLPANSTAIINPDGSVTFTFDPLLSDDEIDEILLGFNPNLIAYDRTILEQAALNGSAISGVPQYFSLAEKRTGKQFSAYIQDTVNIGRLTLSGGLRFDAYNFLRTENGLGPRVGAAYRISETGTIFRASYNRIVQTASTENLLVSGSERASTLVNPLTIRLFGQRTRQIRAERSNWFEIGVRQRTGKFGTLDLAYYRKHIRDLHDNDQFLNTNIIFPISISKGKINGLDVRYETMRMAGLSGYFSMGFVRAVVTPPFSGGLFLSGASVDSFGGEDFIIDHDQKRTIQAGLHYDNQKLRLFSQLMIRYDGGLVTGVSPDDIAELAGDPDTAHGLKYLDLTADPVRVKPRTLVDVSFGYRLIERERLKVKLQFDAINLTNKTGLYNYLSVFGGTNYIPSRSFNAGLHFSF